MKTTHRERPHPLSPYGRSAPSALRTNSPCEISRSASVGSSTSSRRCNAQLSTAQSSCAQTRPRTSRCLRGACLSLQLPAAGRRHRRASGKHGGKIARSVSAAASTTKRADGGPDGRRRCAGFRDMNHLVFRPAEIFSHVDVDMSGSHGPVPLKAVYNA